MRRDKTSQSDLGTTVAATALNAAHLGQIVTSVLFSNGSCWPG